MTEERKAGTRAMTWIALAVLAAAIVFAVLFLLNGNQAGKQTAAAPTLGQYWTEGSEAAQSLRDYVAKVTDPKDTANYIPEKDRIAVFDMDGTLVCETYYTYFDTMMFIEYCLKDHPERVTDELKQAAIEIKPGYTAGEELARNFAKAYAGMTMEEFYDYVVEFGKKETASFTNMRYCDNTYLPMAEVVKYLYENGFTIYVISGTERTTTRAVVANSLFRDYVTPNHVIGTDFEVKQPGHETEASNMNFKYENGDELVAGDRAAAGAGLRQQRKRHQHDELHDRQPEPLSGPGVHGGGRRQRPGMGQAGLGNKERGIPGEGIYPDFHEERFRADLSGRDRPGRRTVPGAGMGGDP